MANECVVEVATDINWQDVVSEIASLALAGVTACATGTLAILAMKEWRGRRRRERRTELMLNDPNRRIRVASVCRSKHGFMIFEIQNISDFPTECDTPLVMVNDFEVKTDLRYPEPQKAGRRFTLRAGQRRTLRSKSKYVTDRFRDAAPGDCAIAEIDTRKAE